jgi:glutamate/aspartate transport system substrate-binding protein
VLSVEPIAIMVRKDDPAIKKLADDTVRDLHQVRRLAQAVRQVVRPADPAQEHARGLCQPATPPRRLGPTRTTNPVEAYAKK